MKSEVGKLKSETTDASLSTKEWNVGVVAGLGVLNTVSVHCKNWATVYGALDCLIAGDKLEIETDGPAISASDTRRYNPCSLEQTDSQIAGSAGERLRSGFMSALIAKRPILTLEMLWAGG